MSREGLALEELLEQGYRKLAQDRARFGSLNYPNKYRGTSLAPMSDLTQRARGLQEYYASKPAPYSGKISSVLSRPTGVGDIRTSNLLGGIGDKQRDYGSSLLGNLQKEFRSSYAPRVERFRQKSEKDIGRGLGEFRGRLSDINTLSSNLDQSSNQATAKALQGLSGQKQARRNLLIDNLEQFGNQKHALANLKNQADSASFDAEVDLPYDKANKLEQVLNAANSQMQSGGIHPDLEPSVIKQLQQAMSAYNTPYQKYPGQFVADSNPELDTSQDLMGRLSTKFRDSFYPERKQLTNQLTGPSSISGRAMDKVPESIKGQIDQLEYAGGKRLKSDLGRLSNQYVRLGQHGSPQHMRAAEERAREINQSILEQRNKLTEGNLKNQLQMHHQSNIGDIKQLGMLGDLGQQEFGDSIKTIRDLNRLGSTKWRNQQAENEELYKNYMNEAMWMWPHMRGQAMKAGVKIGENIGWLDNLMQGGDINLDNLGKLNTAYSELDKDVNNYPMQGDLDSLKKIQETLPSKQSDPIASRLEYLEKLYKENTSGVKPKWGHDQRYKNIMEKNYLKNIQQWEKIDPAKAEELKRSQTEYMRNLISFRDAPPENQPVKNLPNREEFFNKLRTTEAEYNKLKMPDFNYMLNDKNNWNYRLNSSGQKIPAPSWDKWAQAVRWYNSKGYNMDNAHEYNSKVLNPAKQKFENLQTEKQRLGFKKGGSVLANMIAQG